MNITNEEIIDKATELIQPITYEAEHTGYFVLMNDEDLGEEDYCKECIGIAIDQAEINHGKENNEFSFGGHDPDFGGGKDEWDSCPECGKYFYADVYPSLEEVTYLLEDCNLNRNNEILKWKLDIIFYNYKQLGKDVQEIVLSIAKKIYTK